MFLAWAGMNRACSGDFIDAICVPRVGGDEPIGHEWRCIRF
ncbi:hypothetical protein RSK60_750007 [Ralstonia solanacearum K60]|nr:hypothetical protein RSK60_750007 [Ralstonia solanacearum K60]